MRLLFVVDGRSPIALNWIRYFVNLNHEVHMVTTYPCEPSLSVGSYSSIPVAFSGAKSANQSPESTHSISNVYSGSSYVQLRTTIRQWLGPLTLRGASKSLRMVIDRVEPDLIHAMRIPYEGMLVASAFRNGDAAQYKKKLPSFLVSVWGNDFTLHATSTPLMRKQTRATLQMADALHTDCWRDQRLAFQWGFPSDHPTIVLPGGGGIDLDVFSPIHRSHAAGSNEKIVINPRGVRAYIRNDVFFKAAKIVLKVEPDIKFVCIGMTGDKGIVDYVESLGITANVDLLPKVPHSQMARLYQEALIAVSPSTHDGTPNTLLESMACGCFPIAGDIESLREWIIPGENGFLVDPSDPKALAQAIVTSINDETLRLRAAQQNLQLVSTKAAYPMVMAQAEDFYHSIIART